jgi:hypothetical protein
LTRLGLKPKPVRRLIRSEQASPRTPPPAAERTERAFIDRYGGRIVSILVSATS